MAKTYKLGKLPATYDSRDLWFSDYRTGKLPAVPPTFGHENLISKGQWLMLGNSEDDTVAPGFQGCGDCFFAGSAHETMMWIKEAGGTPTFDAKSVIKSYSEVTGYDLNNPNSDQGTDVRAGMKYRAKTGILDAKGNRHKIGAYVALEPGNLDHLYEAIYLFGAVGIGLDLPYSAMDQTQQGCVWSVVPGAESAGGHYVSLVAKRQYVECVTWGQIQPMTNTFYQKYCEEAWVLLSEEMLTSGKSPEGFDLNTLKADLLALKDPNSDPEDNG
jgi:hypothetical protein